MTSRFSRRLLSVLQLTRMALVFTALADSLAATLLWARWSGHDGGDYLQFIPVSRLMAVALMSIGLYGFGMSLNDIIDRRRDSLLASHRPLPSGLIGVRAAHVVCVLLAACALVGGAWLSFHEHVGPMSFVLLLWTIGLITFYDLAGKYLVAPGLLSLGLVRFFHAAVPAPQLPLLWHPLLLMNHITILSTLCYQWENKRPSLTRIHWAAVLGSLALVDALCIAIIGVPGLHRGGGWERLWITPGLIAPGAALLLFLVVAAVIRKQNPDPRIAGRVLMITGLLWLIVYDASFVAGYVSVTAALAVLSLLPIAYFAVKVMRWWGTLLLLSQTPEFVRAR